MKWKKLGKIFDPTEHKLPNDCFEFAQAPQTLVFHDFVRIYFSSRSRDSTGKFLSHICFVDMDKNFKNIRAISQETVIDLGKPGCFDEHGIFPINVLRVGDKIFAYTCGWSRRVSVPVETSTGLAISNDDGITFSKYGDGPVFSSSINEPFLVGDSFVQIYTGKFHMWYIFGKQWTMEEGEDLPARVYKIGYATSDDGMSWRRKGKQIIDDKLNVDECQALPTVIYFGNKYHMFFCYRYSTGFRENKDKGYRIGYAYSSDMKEWIRDDEKGGMSISGQEWDSDMQCYPHIFRCDDKIYLLYNGNEFGKKGFGIAQLIED
jgi:hypothetical protein